MAIDPVCKMKVDPEKAAAKAEYQGQTYYFCAPGCKAAFEKEPEKYLKTTSGGEGGRVAGRNIARPGDCLRAGFSFPSG